MKSLGLFALTLSTAGSIFAAAASQDNWPQWRGPLLTGAAPKATPPTTWSETKNIKWKAKIPGEGHATPIIWGDKVFVQAAIATGKKSEDAAAAPAEAGSRRAGGQSARGAEAERDLSICADLPGSGDGQDALAGGGARDDSP